MTKEEEKQHKKIERIIKKLISEEWIAAIFYEQMVLACNNDERKTIKEIFESNGIDEKNDHYQKLIDFAVMNNLDIPCRIDDYEMYADEVIVKQFQKWSKNKNAGYYISEAIKSEEYAIKSYANVLNDDDLCDCIKQLVLEIYYDEIEHLSVLNTLNLAYNVGAQLKY